MRGRIFLFIFIAFLPGLSAFLIFGQPLKSPPGEKLASILYELVIASIPGNFAEEHGIHMTRGKVRVFVFLDSTSSDFEKEGLVQRHNMVVEKKSDDLLRAMVPLDELIPLSKEPVVLSITLPDSLTKP